MSDFFNTKNIKTLDESKSLSFNTIDKTKLVDVNDIIIDTNKPVVERIKEYLSQNELGYFIKVGKTIVKFEYSDNSKLKAEECIALALNSEFTKLA